MASKEPPMDIKLPPISFKYEKIEDVLTLDAKHSYNEVNPKINDVICSMAQKNYSLKDDKLPGQYVCCPIFHNKEIIDQLMPNKVASSNDQFFECSVKNIWSTDVVINNNLDGTKDISVTRLRNGTAFSHSYQKLNKGNTEEIIECDYNNNDFDSVAGSILYTVGSFSCHYFNKDFCAHIDSVNSNEAMSEDNLRSYIKGSIYKEKEKNAYIKACVNATISLNQEKINSKERPTEASHLLEKLMELKSNPEKTFCNINNFKTMSDFFDKEVINNGKNLSSNLTYDTYIKDACDKFQPKNEVTANPNAPKKTSTQI